MIAMEIKWDNVYKKSLEQCLDYKTCSINNKVGNFRYLQEKIMNPSY